MNIIVAVLVSIVIFVVGMAVVYVFLMGNPIIAQIFGGVVGIIAGMCGIIAGNEAQS